MSDIIRVSSAAELMNALTQASEGDSILLEGGDYGNVRISDLNFSSGVTIRSASDADKANFESIILKNSSNITLNGIDVNLVPDEETLSWDPAIRIDNSSDITILNSNIKGGDAVSGSPPETEPDSQDSSGNIIGFSTGYGIYARDSQRISIENTEISEFSRGVVLIEVDGLNMVNNEIHNVRTSPLSGPQVSNAFIDGNYFHDSNPWKFGGPGDHGDFIHLSTAVGQSSDNITITNNIIDQGEGHPILGIVLAGNSQGSAGFSNVTIENNVIINGNLQGITLHRVDGATVTNNTMIQEGEITKLGPTILLQDDTKNITINNNIVSNYIIQNIPETNYQSVSIDNNLQVQSGMPGSENYIGNLFTNPFGEGEGLEGFQAIPGGVIDQMSVGSTLTDFNTTPDALAGYITNSAGEGFQLREVTLDASHLFGPSSALSADAAEVSWDFGDDTTGQGVNPTHTFTTAGSYDVTAKVTLANGEIVSLSKTIEVETPIVLDAQFNGSLEDGSDEVNAASVGNNVTYEPGKDGSAVRLNGDAITYEKTPDFFGNEEYTLVFDFKKDSGNIDARERVIHFNKNFTVDIDGDGLTVTVTTENSTEWFRPKDLGLNDAQWHSFALTFSGKTGNILLYLDGVEVGRAEGFNGASQILQSGGPFTIGDPWGGGFAGLIDNVGFLRGAMDTEDTTGPWRDIVALQDASLDVDGGDTIVSPVDPTPQPDDPEPEPTPLTGTDKDNRLDGTDDADQINGLGGNDKVYGGGGNDMLSGGDGVDMIDGGSGNDQISGGADSDYIYGRGGNDILHGDSGDDKVGGGLGDDFVYGDSGNDHISGGVGQDLLDGGDGKDKLWAGDGNDTLIGGNGKDTLYGEAGNDILVGGKGNDYLVGGEGADIFVFGAGDGADRLNDFDPGQDSITLQGLDFSTVAEVIDASFMTGSGLLLHLDGPDVDFSWSTSNFVALVGVDKSALHDGNISLVA